MSEETRGRGATLAPRVWIGIALLLGAALRIGAWLALRSAFFCGLPGFEDAVHFARATGLLGDQFPEIALPAGSPLYPYLAALGLRLTGSASGYLLLQSLLGLGLVPLIAWAFAPVLSPRARGIAALLYAVHPLAVFFELRFQPMVFSLWLLLPAMRMLLLQPARKTADAVLGGLLLGLGFALKPWIFALAALAGAWAQVRPRSAELALGDRPRSAAGLVAGALIAFLVLPAALCLYHASLPEGGALWNWTDAQSFHRTLLPETWGTPRAQTPPVWDSPEKARTEANEQMGRGLTPAETAAFYRGRALQLLAENPVRFVGQILRRALLTLNGREVPDPTSARFVLAQHGALLAWGAYVFPLLLALAWIGWRRWRGEEAWRLLWPLLAALAAANLTGLHSAASRWTLVVAALPLIASGLEGLPGLLRDARRAASGRTTLVAALALLVLSALDLPGLQARFERRSEDLRHAASLIAQEDRGRATALLRRAIQEDPESAPAHKDLGDLLLKEDLIDAARGEYERALAIDPAYDPALFGLAEIYRVEGSYTEADSLLTALVSAHPTHPLYLNQLAAVKMLLNRLADARVLLARALEIEPSYETALINLRSLEELVQKQGALAFPEEVARDQNTEIANLGALALRMLQQNNPAAADSLTRAGLERFPDDPLALFFRGAFLLRTGQSAEAAGVLTRVVRLSPGRAMTTGAAVEALVQMGRWSEALSLARESLAQAPDEANRTRIGQMIARLEAGPAAAN